LSAGDLHHGPDDDHTNDDSPEHAMDTADPVLPQVWRWTTNQLATTLVRTNVGLGYVHLPSGLNSEDVAGWDYESVARVDGGSCA